MQDPFQRLGKRLARDDAVSEVVAYTMMFGMGAVALTFALEVMTTTQEQGGEIAAARQMNQVAQVTGTLVEQAATSAHQAPNATFQSSVALPEQFAGLNYTIQLVVPNEQNWDPPPWRPSCPKNPKVRVVTSDEQFNADVRLSNQTVSSVADDQCIVLDTSSTVHSSDRNIRVTYEWTANYPTIRIEPSNR